MSMFVTLWKYLPLNRALRRLALWIFNDRFLIGVTGVIFDDANRILLLKHTYRRIPWSLPGGYLHAHEYPKAGLAREILEETGFTVKIIRIITTKTDQRGRIDLSYFGIYTRGEFVASDEVVNYRFAPLDRLPRLLPDQYEQIHEAYRRKLNYDASKPKPTRRRRHDQETPVGPYFFH